MQDTLGEIISACQVLGGFTDERLDLRKHSVNVICLFLMLMMLKTMMVMPMMVIMGGVNRGGDDKWDLMVKSG